MRLLLLASAASLLSGAAFAQSLLGQSQPGGQSQQPAIAVAPPPAVVAQPAAPAPVAKPNLVAPPPGLVETPLPPPDASQSAIPANADNGGSQTMQLQAVSPSAPPAASPTAPAPGSIAAPPPVNDVPPTPDNVWVPGKTATLGVLNKVEGSTQTITIPVGGQTTVGDLTVSVQACVVRPPKALPDAAVFVTLQPKDDSSGSPVYRGWMVRSAPGATDAGNADEAFRVINCS